MTMVESATIQSSEPIAIVGIGCNLPGGNTSAKAFWDFLCSKGDAIREIPVDRWAIDGFYDPDAAAIMRCRTKWAGFCDDIYSFDPAFFDIAPREAETMDPQQRGLLKVVYEALQDANIPMAEIAKQLTGVFVGISTSDYRVLQECNKLKASDEIYAGTGVALCIASNRISHRFNLKGPSYSLDTACSSSLVAVDQACKNIASGACDYAIAAGVNVMAAPYAFIIFSKANMLSPTGQLSTFDARANGYVRGEGFGAVILKKLSKAEADGDRIYGVIRSTCVNQDGRTRTLTAPSQDSQMEMLARVCAQAGVDPQDVGYVEAHGTGTPTGDPIEAGAIGRVFGKPRAGGPVYVGSVKPNVGHLESGAGITGLIKATMTVHTGMIAPNINFENPNPNIPFEALNIAVPRDVTALPKGREGAFAVVNSFGFGGTNASALVQRYEPAGPAVRPIVISTATTTDDAIEPARPRPVLVPVSAATLEQKRQFADRLAEAMGEGGLLADASLAEIAGSLAHGRDHLNERAVVLAYDRPDCAAKLRLLARGEEAPRTNKDDVNAIVTGRVSADRKLAFTFSGQGSQWWAMGRRLLLEEPVYASSIAAFDSLFMPLSGWSVRDAMLADEADSKVNDSTVTQPTICALQIALARLWMHYGVKPDLVIGHSLGEAAAAHIAGILDLPTTVKYIYTRSLIRDHLGAEGAMAAVGLSADELAPMLPTDGTIDIAGYNGPTMVSIGGDRQAVRAFVERFKEERPGVLCRLLATDTAWHSYQLAGGEAWLRETVGAIPYSAPEIPFISTVTGRLESKFDLDYWWSNLRNPVMYRKAVDFALDLGTKIFLEIAPHRTLSGLTSGTAAARSAPVIIVNSLTKTQDDFASMAEAAAQLHVAGVDLDWQALAPLSGRKCELPRYPWSTTQYVQLNETAKHLLFASPTHPLLGRNEKTAQPSWVSAFTLTAYPFVADHHLHGESLFATAGYIDIMIAAGLEHFGKGPIELDHLKIYDALFIREGDEVHLRTELDTDRNMVRVYSRIVETAPDWVLRCEARIRQRDLEPATAPAYQRPHGEGIIHLGKSRWYAGVDAIDFVRYGPAFQAITDILIKPELRKTWAEIAVHPDLKPTYHRFRAHPALLDAALQLNDLNLAKFAAGNDPLDENGKFIGDTKYIPIGVRNIRFYAPFEDEMVIETSWKTDGEKLTSAANTIWSRDGRALLTIEDVFQQAVPFNAKERKDEGGINAELLQETFASLAMPTDSLAADGLAGQRWLVLADDAGRVDGLTAAITERGATAIVLRRKALDGGALADYRDTFLNHLQDGAGLDGLVFGWGLNHPLTDPSVTCEAILAAVEPDVLALIGLGQALLSPVDLPKKPTVCVLTEGARAVSAGAPLSLAGLTQAPLVSLIRNLTTECEGVPFISIDADAEALAAPATLLAVLLGSGNDSELAIRNGKLFGARVGITSFDALPAKKILVTEADQTANFVVTMRQAGVIDHLEIKEAAGHTVGADDALVVIKAVGLNFRDVMAVTGLLPKEAEAEDAFKNLGLEYSGIVKAVGANVTHIKPGDRVMGFSRRCLQRFMCMPAAMVVPLPDNLPLDGASTIPSAFVTAHYALNHVGRLRKGERILIHVATGGVGLAAIQLAKRVGAEIFATAGSEAKRQYLRDLGIQHVMNSRTLDFAEEVMAITNGQGVDVILNSLPSHFIDKGFDIIAPYGRFLEIGKRDVYANTPIGMKVLRKNVQFACLDLAALGAERPAYMMEMLYELNQMFANGEIAPLPLTAFPLSAVKDAFRFMSQAKHIGKVVVTLDEPETAVALSTEKAFTLNPQASYLVTGGSRGFGVAVADWMSRIGAGRIVLGSRSGTIADDEAERVAAMCARGTIVEAVRLDVNDAAETAAVIASLAAHEKPLAGIMHGAAVIDDGLIPQFDDDHITRVIRPKVAGAWNLHQALAAAACTLDFFVSFSSTSQLLGARGQANYVAANAFLDAFAAWRKSQGQAGFTVDWGPLAGAGFVARNEALASYLESIGLQPLPEPIATGALAGLLRVEAASLGFGGFEWSRFRRANAGIEKLPRLAGLVADVRSGNARIRAELKAAPREAWPELVNRFLAGEIAKVLKVDVADVPTDRLLTELGLDSLSSFELKNRIEGELDLGLPVSKFLQAPTVEKLAEVIVEMVAAQETAEAAAHEAASRAGSEDGAATQQAAGQFRASDRQAGLVALSLAPMTSDTMRAGLEASAQAEVTAAAFAGADGDIAALTAAWEAIATRYPLLGLRMRKRGQPGTLPELGLDAAPAIRIAHSEAELHAALAMAEGELVRLAVLLPVPSEGAPSNAILKLTAHSAVMPALAVPTVLAELIAHIGAEAPIAEAISQANLYEHLAARAFAEHQATAIAHRAFWYEALLSPAKAITIPGRGRALAPAGLGRNHGPQKRLAAHLPAGVLAGVPGNRREALLLTAFGLALAKLTNAADLAITRIGLDGTPSHDASRYARGPLTVELPVPFMDVQSEPAAHTLARTERHLAAALRHQAFDLSRIEHEFRPMLDESGAHLAQIGFVDVAGLSPADARDVAATLEPLGHDLALMVGGANDHGAGQLTLAYDGDVVADDLARSIIETLAATVAELTGDQDTVAMAPALVVTTMEHTLPTLPAMPERVEREPEDKAVPPSAIYDVAAEQRLAVETREPEVGAQDEPAAHGVASGEIVFPVSAFQAMLFEGLDHPACTPAFRHYWTLAQALRISTAIDPKRLGQAFDKLTARHESTRMRFRRRGDGWQAVIGQHQTGYTVTDLGAVSDAALQEILDRLVFEPFDFEAGPLVKLDLFKCGKGRDVLLFRAHHLVTDGWSQITMIDELIKSYIGIPTFSSKPIGFGEYLTRFEQPSLASERNKAYWDRLLLPVLKGPRMGRVAHGLEPNTTGANLGQTAQMAVTVDSRGLKNLQAVAKRCGATTTNLLMAAFAQAIAKRGSVEGVYLNSPVAGREHPALQNYVGFVANYLPVRCEVARHNSVTALATAIHEQMRQSMTCTPSLATVRDMALEDALNAQGAQFRQFHCGMFLPETILKRSFLAPLVQGKPGQPIKLGSIQIDMLKLQPNRLTYRELDLRTLERPEELELTFSYETAAYLPGEVRSLIDKMLDSLAIDAERHGGIRTGQTLDVEAVVRRQAEGPSLEQLYAHEIKGAAE